MRPKLLFTNGNQGFEGTDKIRLTQWVQRLLLALQSLYDIRMLFYRVFEIYFLQTIKAHSLNMRHMPTRFTFTTKIVKLFLKNCMRIG